MIGKKKTPATTADIVNVLRAIEKSEKRLLKEVSMVETHLTDRVSDFEKRITNDVADYKDQIIGEVQDLRDETDIALGKINDHEEWIVRLEAAKPAYQP